MIPILFKPHAYQDTAGQHLKQYEYAGLFLDMGLGKTIVTLLDIAESLKSGRSRKVLVIAPKRVAENTWTDEAAKWIQTKDMRISVVSGKRGEVDRKNALRKEADIYTIGIDNLAWLIALYGSSWPFDTVVVDELSMFKSHSSKRFKAIKMILPLTKRIIALTGTPMSNGLIDLWSQIFILDRGERLGKTITWYRNEYFSRGRQIANHTYEYELSKGTGAFGKDIYEKCIFDKISDICISMNAKDYLDLPDRIDVQRKVYLSDRELKDYKTFEREAVLEIFGTGETVTAVNAAALSGKLLQYANGAIYTTQDRSEYRTVHNNKLEALGDVLDAANGAPVLVLYSFKHDITRIKEYLGKDFKIFEMNTPNVLERWNRKELPVLLGHPKSMGHGLNMQKGGNNIAHFGLNWSLELYRQVIKRLDRQGQDYSVLNSLLTCMGTLDERVISRLQEKGEKEDEFLDYIKALVKDVTKGVTLDSYSKARFALS